MFLYRRFPVVTLIMALAVSVAAWNGSTHKVAAQDSGTIIAQSGFKPEIDGFGFPNYSAENKPYVNMTPTEVHRMFGDQVCEPGTEAKPDCTLLPPAREWMDTTNTEMDGGHCGGMAILSELFYTKKVELSDFGADSTVNLPFQDKVEREIAYWWGTNAVPTKQDVKGKPSEIVDILVKSFQTNDETYSLEVWQSATSSEGHAVTPYAVKDMGDGIMQILVYDNNAPKETGFVEVNRNNETWKYNLSVNPSVEPAIWTGNAESDTLFLARQSPRLGQQEPAFDLPTTSRFKTDALLKPNTQASHEYNAISLLSRDNTYADILITDDQGHRFGIQGNKLLKEIPGAFINRLPNTGIYGNEIEPIYYIPAGIKFTITLDGSALNKAAVNDVVMIGPGYDLTLDGINVKPGSKDTIVFSPDGTQIAYTPSDSQAPNIGLGLEHQGADYAFNILGSDVDKNGTINVSLDYDKGVLTLHTTGNQNVASFDLTVDRFDNATQQSFEHNGLDLEPSETAYIEFGKWDGKGDLSIGVDSSSDGTIDETQAEPNQKN